MSIDNLDDYYLEKDEPLRSCLLALRDLILKQDERVVETRKWGMPCFCFRKKMFCFLSIDKKTQEPYLLMVEGRNLKHSLLEQGNRTRMKVLQLNSREDLPIEVIEEILTEALVLANNK